MPPPLWVCRWLSAEEIVIILRVEVILCPGLAAEGLAVGDFLQVVQAAGNPFVAVAVEGVEVDRCPAVHAGIYFGAFQDRVLVSVHDAGGCAAVGVDKIAVFICLIIWAFRIAVAQGSLQDGEGGDAPAAALQF